MNLSIEWALYSDSARFNEQWPLRFRVNPRCRAFVKLRMLGDDTDERCGKPATVRANRLPYWSMKFCPEHAADFAGDPA